MINPVMYNLFRAIVDEELDTKMSMITMKIAGTLFTK